MSIVCTDDNKFFLPRCLQRRRGSHHLGRSTCILLPLPLKRLKYRKLERTDTDSYFKHKREARMNRTPQPGDIVEARFELYNGLVWPGNIGIVESLGKRGNVEEAEVAWERAEGTTTLLVHINCLKIID